MIWLKIGRASILPLISPFYMIYFGEESNHIIYPKGLNNPLYGVVEKGSDWDISPP